MPAIPRTIHGDDLLYRFFNNLLTDKSEAFAAVPQLLLETMAIWWPLETYATVPVLLPWVVRDPSCRGAPKRGIPDEWGSPDDSGYLRDDNSLIKSLPRSLSIRGPRLSGLSGARIGTEFVAAHVWRKVKDSPLLASRWPELNSFVPNLVWLPGQVAKLTDREGSGVQETLQVMSWTIYRDVDVESRYAELTERAWSLLPLPARLIRPLDAGRLNWFEPTERFYATRAARLACVVNALRDLEAGVPLRKKVITTRYTSGLPSLDPYVRRQLLERLSALAD